MRVLKSIPAWEVVAGSLAFFPVFTCLLQGQDSILQLLLCVLGFNAIKDNNDLKSGFWFGVGMFKFQFIIPIVLLSGIWKRKRAVVGFLLVVLLLILISVELAGWGVLVRYPAFVLQIANAPSLGGVAADFAPNLRGIILGWPLRFAGTLGTVVAMVSSLLVFVFAVAREKKGEQAGKFELRFSLAVIISVLIAWQTNMHDLTLLVLPMVLIADYVMRAPTEEEKFWKRYRLLIPAVPLLISPLWLVVWIAEGKANLMAIPLLWRSLGDMQGAIGRWQFQA